MLEVVVRAAICTLLLAFVVQLCLWTLRVRHPKLLLAPWTAVLVASVAMPALQRAIPSAAPTLLFRSFSRAGIVNSSVRAPPLPFSVISSSIISSAISPSDATTARASEPHQTFAWRRWLTGAYVLVAALLLLRPLLGLILSWRMLRATHPVREDWAAGKRLRTNTWICAPVTVGSNVLLPAECVNWDERRRQAVLAHEESHIARGDFYIQLLSQVNRSVFWFSPLAWWLHRRLTALAELASDDAAIEALGDRPGYAAILLDVARLPRTPSISVAMARPATVSQRIERILAEETTPAPVSRLLQTVIAAAVAPLAMLTAVLFAEAAPVEASKEQVAPHTRITIDPKLLDAYAGFYLNAVTDSLMIVTREDDHLLTRRAGEQPVAEYPYTDHDFFLTVVPKQNSFITDASGAVLRVVHHQWGRDETLERISVEAAQRHEEARLKRVAEERTPRTAISIDPQLLDNYVGAYQLKPQLVFTVTREGDRLLAKLTGQQTYEVHPYTERDFSYTIVAAQLSFVPGADGKASAVVLHQNGKDQTAPRVDLSVAQALDVKLAEQSAPRTAVKIDPRLLDSYVGRYSNAELEITATREGEQLFVQVTGYGRYAIFPYTERDFFATIQPTQYTFATDNTGKATQMVRHRRGKDEVFIRED
jgi:beta-lactamase regulating signal transducer with metallopeptidase domain